MAKKTTEPAAAPAPEPQQTATQKLRELEGTQHELEAELRNLDFQLAAPVTSTESPTEQAALALLGRAAQPQAVPSRGELKERRRELTSRLEVVQRAMSLLAAEVSAERRAHSIAVCA